MTRRGIVSLPMCFLLMLAGAFSLPAEPADPAPNFKQVYDLIREHLTGINEAELNRAAIEGLLSNLGPRVLLIGKAEPASAQEIVTVTRTSLFEGGIGYVRVGRVAAGLEQAVQKAWQDLGATNKLNGLVIDLRFAGGTDYAAAASTADLFARKEQPLLDWGQGMVRSKEKTEGPALPLGVLVNHQTAGAAEALAAVLREIGAALILGTRTAGQAMIAQDYPLQNGEQLRIATSPIDLGDGSHLSSQGVKPDIAVEVSATDERAFYEDPFRELPRGGLPVAASSGVSGPTASANRPRRPRFNEAELVRERRDGVVGDPEAVAASGDPEKPAVRDPVLARALDFLKGLSVIRQTRS
jgi:hypothetical protein